MSQDSSRYRQRRRQRAKDFPAPRTPATGCETARSGLASGLPTIVQVAHPFADVLRRRCGLFEELRETHFGELRWRAIRTGCSDSAGEPRRRLCGVYRLEMLVES